MHSFRKEIDILVIFGITLVILCLAILSESTKQNSLDDMIASTKRPVKNLDCYICHSEQDSQCTNFTNPSVNLKPFESQCDANATMCMVRKFSFTVSNASGIVIEMNTFATKRNCSSHCEPGCVIMGERTRLYVCNSCCTTSLCNTGSHSESWGPRVDWILFSFLASLAFC